MWFQLFLLASSTAAATDLTVRGTCGSTMDIEIGGVTPGGPVALYSAADSGDTAMPAACPGQLGLDEGGLTLRGEFTAGSTGEVVLSPFIPLSACGTALQALEWSTCSLSPVRFLTSSCYLETFEDGVWPVSGWTSAGSGIGTISTSAAYSGTYSLFDPEWYYNTDVGVFPGDVMSAYVNVSTGRTYLGFDADVDGAKSFVIAPNSTDIRFQRNKGYGYEELTTMSVTIPTGEWLRAEIEIIDRYFVEGRLYDTDGDLLASVTQEYDEGIEAKGIAIRSFGTHYVDDIEHHCP